MSKRFSNLRIGAACSALILGMTATAVSADETDARNILKAMSDYLSGEQTLSFDYDAMLEVVTTEDQKLGTASSGAVNLARPDKLYATKVGGFAEIEMVFDGATFSLLGKHTGVYTQMPVSGSIDNLVDSLRTEHGFALPAADLLAANPYDILMSEVTDVKDLGAGVIGGQVCDHLAFRTKEVDWQIWIATGEKPYPCRYMITTHTMAQGPQYTIDIRDWRGGANIAPTAFVFAPPDSAKAAKFGEIQSLVSEFPNHYDTGENK